MTRKYIIKVTKKEQEQWNVFDSTVRIDEDMKLWIGDPYDEIVLTQSQVSKLRRIIDRNYPLA